LALEGVQSLGVEENAVADRFVHGAFQGPPLVGRKAVEEAFGCGERSLVD
jgi:hypothetical protein